MKRKQCNQHSRFKSSLQLMFIIPPVYEVYRGYIVFAFSVCVCKLFFVKDFSGTTVPSILKFGTNIGYVKLYCVLKNEPHMAYQSLYLSIFLSFQKYFSSKISQQLLDLGF